MCKVVNLSTSFRIVHRCVCVCVSVCCVCVCCVCVCVGVCVCVCVFYISNDGIHAYYIIYTHTHIHTHTYIHTYIHTESGGREVGENKALTSKKARYVSNITMPHALLRLEEDFSYK